MTSSGSRPLHQSRSTGWSHALPLELRTMIWQFTLPTHQMHLLKDSCSIPDRDRQTLEICVPVPVAFQVCRESRQVAAKHLDAIPRTDNPADTRTVYCDLATDSLLLDMRMNFGLSLFLDQVPAAWKPFKQIHVWEFDFFDWQPNPRDDAAVTRVTRELKRLFQAFPNTQRLVPTRVMDPDGHIHLNGPGFLSFAFTDKHLMRYVHVGGAGEPPFPEHVLHAKFYKKFLSMEAEHEFWTTHVAELPGGYPRPRVHSAVARVQCKHQLPPRNYDCYEEGIVYASDDERFFDNDIPARQR
ncbi:hypothetical protein QIS74_09162 [Colletotrichum tabaci]|uniref:2EXR domain-containing protein n=1 Tax=Colletotrichum tabaci TaxID=1209068 RepID=A0AAV9T3B6_9PEZI